MSLFLNLLSLILLRRPGRWLRRTGWLAGQVWVDLGLGTAAGPIWLRDNPFLRKASRIETRRFGLSLRLLVTVLVLSVLLIGGLWLNQRYGRGLAGVLGFLFQTSFPAVLLIVLSFVHTLLIINARTALTVSLAEEARRGTLADLLLTPLRRAEMLLAMGVGPARTAFTVALAGLPLYALLGQIGVLTIWEIAALYVLFALLCYQPPTYAFPALSGMAQTPDAPQGQFATVRNRRAGRKGSVNIGLSVLPGLLIFSQSVGLLGGVWAAHLLSALHLPSASRGTIFLVFAWPYYAAQILSERIGFFHLSLSPLLYVLPLVAMHWIASALRSAAALSAGDLAEMGRLPLDTRTRTVARWTARSAGLCGLGVVWKAWVESGDTASLAGSFNTGPGWDAAGLLLLLGGFSLLNVCRRALAVTEPSRLRPPSLLLRRALRRSLRPLGVAGLTFLIACALGGLSPFALPVYQTAGQIALVGVATVVWTVGVRRLLPLNLSETLSARFAPYLLLYGLPFLALSLPVPALWILAALSPVSAWVRLFAGGPGLVARFPFWTLGTLPSLSVCVGGAFLVGVLLLATAGRKKTSAANQVSAKREEGQRAPARYETQTAALMGWVTAHTDNPILIYELRSRTRSGLWYYWGVIGAVLFAASLVVALSYPDFVSFVPLLSPLHFFGGSLLPGLQGSSVSVWADLAALLLSGQCYVICFRGQMIGESLIARDRQRGVWGFILLTLLTTREIFWGKVFGQTASVWATWAAAGFGSLLLYGLAAPSVGLGPALAAWGTGQVFVAAVFTLGMGLGTALATFPIVLKSLRGLSMLLFVGLVGLGLYGQYQFLPFDLSGGWNLLAERLLLGSGYALILAVPLFVFAEWRLSRVRRQDIAFGNGPQ